LCLRENNTIEQAVERERRITSELKATVTGRPVNRNVPPKGDGCLREHHEEHEEHEGWNSTTYPNA